MKITRLVAALAAAFLSVTAMASNAQASNCYIREYQNEATIGVTHVPVAPEASTATDQTPVAIGAAASSAAFQKTTNLVRLICGANASFTFSATSTPAATTSNSYLAAGIPEYFAVVPGQYVSFISNATP